MSSTGSLRCPTCSKETLLTSSDFTRLNSDISVNRLLESLKYFGLSDSGTSTSSASTKGALEARHAVSATSLTLGTGSSVKSYPGVIDVKATPPGIKTVEKHGFSKMSLHSPEESIFPLRSSGFDMKSPVAPNQFYMRQDSSNISLAISSAGNTATDKTVSSRTSSTAGLSSSGESSNPTDRINVVMERFCEQHPHMCLELFCRNCKMAICRDCVNHKEEHYRHAHGDLQLEADFMRRELKAISRESSEAIAVVDKALHTLSSQQNSKNSVNHQLESIEEEIKATAKSMMTKICNDMNGLLEEVKRIRQAASTEQLETMKSEIETGRKMATLVHKRGDSIDVANVHNAIVDKMQRANTLCAEGGSVDRLQEIAIRFAGNDPSSLELGRLQEDRNWEVHKKIEIPLDKRGHMQGMTSLPDGRIAVGYDSGGIDIIHVKGVHKPVRILDDVKILDLVSTSDGNIIAYPMFGRIKEITANGRELPTSFTALESKEHVSLSRGNDGRILFGYAEHNKIQQFHQSGGIPLQVIPTRDIKPQQIDITRSGKVVAKDKAGVKILDLKSQEVTGTIPVDKGHFAYSTCDVKDNVYVAKVAVRKSVVSIAKYTVTGEFLETVSDVVKISTNASGKHWLRLVSLSPSLLAVCDGSSVLIYRRQPSILELVSELTSN